MARLEIEIAGNNANLIAALKQSEDAIKSFSTGNALPKAMDSARLATQEARTEAIKMASVLKSSLSESLNNAKIYTEGLKQANIEATNSLIKQREATEAYRSETAKSRSEIAQLALENKKLGVSYTTGAGSLVEMRTRLSQLNKIYDNLSVSARNSLKVQSNLVPEIQRLTSSISQAEQSTGRFQRQVGNYALAGGNANGVAMEFNRIIQDAPFGMMGISNNLTQLIDNYKQYAISVQAAAAAQNKTISGFQIFKGAIGSILSPVNLLSLGVAAVTSAFIVYEKWQQRKNKAIKDTKVSLTEYIESLKGVNRATADGQVNATKDITNLKLLYDATQNLTIPMDKRKKAADELIKQYPKQFEGLTNESILAGKASEAYDKLTKSITATAMASAYANKMTENAQKQLNNYLQIIDKQNEANKLTLLIEKEKAKQLKQTAAGSAGTGSSGAAQATLGARYDEQRANILKEINNLGEENGRIQKENNLLQEQYNGQVVKGADLNGTLNTELKKTDDLSKKIKETTNDIVNNSLSYYDKQVAQIRDKYSEIYKLVGKETKTGLLAQQNAWIEELKVKTLELEDIFARVFDPAKSGITGLSGGINKPEQLPNLAWNQWGINNRRSSSSTGNKDDEALEKRLGKIVERGMRQGISDIFGDIENLGSNFYEVFSNVFGKLSKSITGMFQNVLATQLGDVLSKKINSEDFSVGGLSSNASKALVAGIGTAGSLISGMSSKKSYGGQIAGGALSGAAAGMAFGPYGAAVGAVIGAASGWFSASAANKRDKIQEQQLAEQRKQSAQLERQNALAYTASITGQASSSGIVTGVDRNAFGDIVFRVAGRELVGVMTNEENAQKRGL